MKLPQLSLRELFLLVVIAAMGCGWWVDRLSLARIVRDVKSNAESLRRNGERLESHYFTAKSALERDGYEVLEWGPDNCSLSIHPKHTH
jgi:hypothetical protein